jgi:hypothetical protein
MVEGKFELKQKDAANEFGISLTAFKQVCRKLGVDRWPYRRPNRALAAGTVKLLSSPSTYTNLSKLLFSVCVRKLHHFPRLRKSRSSAALVLRLSVSKQQPPFVRPDLKA